MTGSNKKKHYLPFSQHLKEMFGERVYKIGIDAGFTCPNRDGTLGTGGCIYCYGSRTDQHLVDLSSIKAQIDAGKAALVQRYNAQKFLAYFQSFTNTYAEPDVLESLYQAALEEDGIVGMSIGTRPDCVDEPVLDVIEGLAQHSYLWVEYGLQSVHNRTLEVIHRGHDFADFLDAVGRTKQRQGIRICAHVILGLPGETKADIVETARTLSGLRIDGVKIHSAHVLKGTQLEHMYLNGDYQPPERTEYVEIVCDFLEHLAPEISIHRLVGDAPRSRYVAPEWCLNKSEALRAIDTELERRNSHQGSRLERVTHEGKKI